MLLELLKLLMLDVQLLLLHLLHFHLLPLELLDCTKLNGTVKVRCNMVRGGTHANRRVLRHLSRNSFVAPQTPHHRLLILESVDTLLACPFVGRIES